MVARNNKYIRLSLLFLALPWFFELLFFIQPPWGLSLAAFISPSLDEYCAASFLIIFFLLVTYISATYSSRILIPCANSSFFLASRGILKCCRASLPLFTVLDLYFVLSSLQGGLFQTLLAFRFNDISIGYLGYFVLYYFPIVLTISWSVNKSYENILYSLLIVSTNLLTGFRTLLISSIIIFLIYNSDYLSRISRSIKLATASLFVSILISYGMLRSALELGDSVDPRFTKSFVDVINRSYPMRYLTIYFRENVSAIFSDFATLFISPVWVLIQKAYGDYSIDDGTIIAERFVRPYLLWRGTPDSLATGFSIHIVPFSLVFYGLFGLLFFAILIGFSIGIGITLSRFEGILPRLLGAFLITFALSACESFVSGYGSLLYRLAFLLPLIFFSAFSLRSSRR